MNNAFRPIFRRDKGLYFLAAALVAGLSVSVAQSQIINLANGNSTASVDLGSQAGMNSWTINNQQQLQQQWFWYRVGSAGPQASIDTLTLSVPTHDANSLQATYTSGSTFSINLSYTLNGGQAGGNDWNSDITESITINNLTGAALDFHFFQYSDFSLAGTLGGEMATIFQNGGFFSKANVTKMANQLSETIDIPLANEAEAALAATTKNELNTIPGYTLNNNLSSGPGATDATWAFQWDFTIDPNGSVDVIKDKKLSVAPVPEPATFALLALGLATFAVRRNRRSA